MPHNNTILVSILFIFVITGFVAPLIGSEFGETVGNTNIEGLEEDVGQEADNINAVNFLTSIKSILSMFFWTFGLLPLWLDLFFIIFRIVFFVIIFDKFRGIN